MRAIAAILFLLGIPWALIAWIAIFGGPAAIIEELIAGRMKDVLALILFWPIFAAHVGLGYFVWARWSVIIFDRTKSTRRFWLAAASHHLVWIAFGCIYRLLNDPLPPLILWYSAAVFCACLVAAAMAPVDRSVAPVA